MPHSISVDWLQLHCRGTSHIRGEATEVLAPGKDGKHVKELVPHPGFGRFVLKNIGRFANFRNVYEVFESDRMDGEIILGERVATLAANPDKGFLKPDSCFLKVDNKFLYNRDLKALCVELLDALRLTFRNISRIDLACDFERFKNNLDPEEFIARVVSRPGRYVKLRNSKIVPVIDHRRENIYKYLRFGTRKSNLCYYLYNKSAELHEVKNKPWIREKWLQDEMNGSRDVWRLEFAIHSCSKGIIDSDYLELKKKYFDALHFLKTVKASDIEAGGDLESAVIAARSAVQTFNEMETGFVADAVLFSSLNALDHYDEIFRGLFHHYFDFRYNGPQQKKCRLRKLPLLDLERPKKNVMNIVSKIESNRTDKIILAGLMRLNNEMRSKNIGAAKFSNDTQDIFAAEKFHAEIEKMIAYYTSSRSLEEWVKLKHPENFEKLNTIFGIPSNRSA